MSAFYKTDRQARETFATDRAQRLLRLLDRLKSGNFKAVIYSNFAEVDDAVFGNYGNKVPASFIFQLRKLNYELMILASRRKELFINDTAGLAVRHGLENTRDLKQEVNADMAFSLPFTAAVASNIVQIILPLTGRMKKCLILDLDNTLWGGIIGDDGMENIQVGELGIGKAFTALQKWVKELKERGIILAVCSQNDPANAREPFEKHPDMVLRMDDISLFVANWDSKAVNIRYIQSVLNIGFDSIVFIDDNPFERELIKREIPEVFVPDLPSDPALYVQYLAELNLFETSSWSNEDTQRTKQYQAEAQRTVLRQAVGTEADFLQSLEMVATVGPFDKFNTPRVAQLTQRSNQFNLRTVRYTENDIASIRTSPDHVTLSFVLKDKFGDHGLIAALILKENGNAFFIDTWVMSCRVLKRGMEQFIMNTVINHARQRKLSHIEGEYLPTSKNGIVKDLLPSLNFQSSNGKWLLKIEPDTNYKTFIHDNE
jgi:FkbH-like protein